MKSRNNVLMIGLAVLVFAGVAAMAETDTRALTVIELVKDGSENVQDGVNGLLRSPRINAPDGTGSLRGPDDLEGTPTAGVTLADGGDWLTVQRTTLTVNKPLTVTYGGFGTNSAAAAALFTFPPGRILVHGVTVKDLKVTPTYTNDGFMGNDDGDFALGTTSNTAATLATTEVDLCPSTSLSTMTNATDAALATSAQFDGTSTAKEMIFNLLVDADEISANSTGTVSGTITFTWTNLGDY